MRQILITFCATILILGCSTNRAQFKGVPFEKHTTLNGTGFTQEKLDSLTSHIKNNLTTTGMLVLKDSKIIFEYGDVQDLSYLASCRKSVLSMLYGKYVENGTIDLNQTIGEIGIEEDNGLLEIEKTATVDHVGVALESSFQNAAGGIPQGEPQTQGDVGVREDCLRELLDSRCTKRCALQWRSQNCLRARAWNSPSPLNLVFVTASCFGSENGIF